MNPSIALLLSIGIFFISLFLVGFWQRHLRLRAILDKPNHRSSHNVPTPRGGGLGIYLAFALGILIAWYYAGSLETRDILLFLGASLVFWVGLWDDFKNTKRRLRLGIHILSAILAYIWFHEELNLWIIDSFGHHSLIPIIAFIWIVCMIWSINLFNFMDGINGIAGMETVFVSSTFAILLNIQDSNQFRFLQMGLLSFATLGFLFWNFPRAFVFMGDCGSGFLGFILFAIGSWMVASGYMKFYSFLVLTSLFWVDATLTLIYRSWNRENIFEAHNRHVYQILARKWRSHTIVTIVYALSNVFILLPIIYLIEHSTSYTWFFFGILLFVQFVLFYKIQSGENIQHGS